MKRKILIDISVTVLFSITTALAQDLISFGNDSLSFTNMNSNPYYFTVESLPNLDGLEERDSTYNGLRNIHLPDGTITLPVGKYSRGVGRTNPIYSVGGNAAAGDILTGKTAYVNDGEINGTMPNRGTVNFTPSTATQVISQGYHSGSGSVAGSANLVPSNIKLGVNIFGVNGSVVGATGSAADSSVLAGQIFSCAGAVNRTGTMPNRSGHVSAQSSSISGTTLRFRPQSG